MQKKSRVLIPTLLDTDLAVAAMNHLLLSAEIVQLHLLRLQVDVIQSQFVSIIQHFKIDSFLPAMK